MRRRWSGIGAELVPLVLILAGLAGSLALVVTVHRRYVARPAPRSTVAVVSPPTPIPPKPPPIPTPVVEPPPEPPAPVPEDPTPRAVEKYTQAEAEQLLEASRADRKAASIEEARKAALVESEKWRRRESLARLQLNSVDAKVRKFESQVEALALERDALEKERDARKALASKAQSRPSQAILPHRGQNGTWRRPIVIECVNGMAILRPLGIGFGLLEIASGFGPTSNAFVATVAREAIRVQGQSSPDGQAVVPYIFFLVRPDGIRPYYEARGRLEPLGITFGYELADQDWEVDFPDLDDVKAWDGSAPSTPGGLDPLVATPNRPGGDKTKAEDEDFPSWGLSNRGASSRSVEPPGGEFVWPTSPRPAPGNGGGVDVGSSTGSSRGMAGDPGSSGTRPKASRPVGLPDVPAWIDSPRGGNDPRNAVAGPAGSNRPSGSPSDAPRELALGGGPIRPLEPTPSASPIPDEVPPPGLPPALEAPATNRGSTESSDDPANSFVWPRPSDGGARPRRPGPGSKPGGDPASPDHSSPNRHAGPFSRPLAMGLDPSEAPGSPGSPVESDPTRPDGEASGGTGSRGQAGTSGGSPPSGTIGAGGMPSGGSPPSAAGSNGPAGSPSVPSPKIIDRRFEIVLVCGPRGVVVQPGSYRVTAEALKDRDGLLKKQMVALVKARRTADPSVIVEPRVRFLIQPGGEKTYFASRSQFLLTGLDWPMSTQVADPDHLSIIPAETW